MLLKRCAKTKVKVGQSAPDFSLSNQSGDIIKLSDYKGKKSVVLYFYPKDNTQNCIVESYSFRDAYGEFKAAGAEIIGISSDSPESHRDFAGKYQLPFPLLSDTKNVVRKLYGVPATFGLIPGRVTFIIDKNGVIQNIYSSQFSPKSHVESAREALLTRPHP